jgi:hypothetical protein
VNDHSGPEIFALDVLEFRDESFPVANDGVRSDNVPSRFPSITIDVCLTPNRHLADCTVNQHHKIDQITPIRPAERHRKTCLGA